jgi:HK97 family phage prohead protease
MSLYAKSLALIDADIATEGSFEALVACFGGEPDRQGDVIHRGAFTNSLAAWRQLDKALPIIWSHRADDPAMIVGRGDMTKSRETAEGLIVAGQLNIFDSPVAAHVRDLLLDGSINSWSFGFKVVRSTRRAGGGLNLLEVDLGECGPCAMAAQPRTRTLAVKGLEPERREPRIPSHVELEGRLRQEGIISRVVPEFTDDEHDVILSRLMARRGNGHGPADAEKAVTAATKAGAIRIASFDCR